jgi:hypothetical protein
MKNFQWILLSKFFPKLCMFLLLLCLCTILAPSCPVSCQPSCSSPPLIWVRRGGVIPPLQLPNDGPYAVLHRGPRSFTIQVGSRDEVIAVSRLKACMAADAMPAARVATADSRVFTQPVLPQPSESHLQTRWFLRLLHQRHHKMVPETFSYLARRFLHARDRRRLHSLHRHGTPPINGYRPRG